MPLPTLTEYQLKAIIDKIINGLVIASGQIDVNIISDVTQSILEEIRDNQTNGAQKIDLITNNDFDIKIDDASATISYVGYAADIDAIASLVASLVASGDLTLISGSTPGDMSCDISSASSLSPENLAAAVWNALAVQFNNAGTMGEIMNNMGAVSDPWSVDLTPYIIDGTAGKRLKELLTRNGFIGLK